VTRLLVSVRSAAEAQIAMAGGADLIDVKEPRGGSLGAASPEVWREVAAVIAEARPLSAALGELMEFEPPPCGALDGYRYAKLGLSGCRRLPDWRKRWQAALAGLPKEIAAVAVAYADHEAAQAPTPMEICAAGTQLSCRVLLIDTFDKGNGDVFDAIGNLPLTALIYQARLHNLRFVLAGSLRLSRLDEALALSPDYIAIRGAACPEHRNGALSGELVRLWADRLQAISPGSHASAAPGRPWEANAMRHTAGRG
jgi:uncharacterized protein (UPF0264 family)